MSTADKLNAILNTKAAIRQAIINKGVKVGDDTVFADYPAKIDEIKAGSGGGEEITGSYIIAKFSDGISESRDYIKKATELDVSHLDVSKMRDMNRMFEGYRNLTALDLSSWDVSNIEDMTSMFSNCRNIITFGDISNWNTSSLRQTESMFRSCQGLTKLNLSNWYVNNLENMNMMFESCENLEVLDLRNWNVSNLVQMEGSFYNCNKLNTIRLDNCSNDIINKIITSGGFPTNAIGTTRKIYVEGEKSVAGLTPPRNWIFVDSDGNEIGGGEKPVCKFCGKEGCDGSCTYCPKCGNLFKECKCESGEPEGVTTYVIATFNTTDEVTIMGEPNYCWLSSYDEGNTWESESNTTRGNQVVYLRPDENFNVVHIYRLFEGCSYLTDATFIGFSNVSFMPNSDYMFNGCVSLESLDLNNINLDDFINVGMMFEGCDNLRDLHLEGCSNVTISKIITSERFPTNTIEGVTRKIYCTEENAAGLIPPTNWVFEYVN